LPSFGPTSGCIVLDYGDNCGVRLVRQMWYVLRRSHGR
jgi:hypothetical protein